MFRLVLSSSCFAAALLVGAPWVHADGAGYVDLAGARAVDLSVSRSGACAVTEAGRLVCWGDNRQGQLGLDKQNDRLPPTLRSDVTDALRVFLADTGGCAKQRSGAITCWGMKPGSAVERFLGGGLNRRPTEFAISTDHGCGIIAGKIQCWEPAYRVAVPRPVQVSAGPFRNCARARQGAVWCWGGTGGGLHTAPPPSGVLSASPVPGIADAVDLSVSAGRNCVVLRSGDVDCWQGQTLSRLPKLERIINLEDAMTVSAAANHACAIRRDRRVACWGYDNLAHPVPELTNVVQLESGFSNTCARLASGAVLCLGPNDSRQLGIHTPKLGPWPTAFPPPSIEPVVGLDKIAALSVGEYHACAVRSDGAVFCWGANWNGQLGIGTLGFRATP